MGSIKGTEKGAEIPPGLAAGESCFTPGSKGRSEAPHGKLGLWKRDCPTGSIVGKGYSHCQKCADGEGEDHKRKACCLVASFLFPLTETSGNHRGTRIGVR